MSGNLRLNGATSGYSQISAADVAGDQTFMLPETGGTLAVTTNNSVANIGGYQQGTFPATVESTSGNSVWMKDGVSEVDSQGSPLTYPYSKFNWFRVGQLVTINVYFRAATSGLASDTSSVYIGNYPYKAPVSTDQEFNQYFVSCFAPQVLSTTTFETIFAQIINYPSSGNALYTGDRSGFQLSNLTAAPVGLQAKDVKALGVLAYQISYETDDTTWTPINGATVS